MQSVYVSDFVPSRRIAQDRASVPTGPSMRRQGVGAFTNVRSVAPVVSSATAKSSTAKKNKVRVVGKAVVTNGPLARRAEPSKRSLTSGVAGVRGFSRGVAGKAGAAMYAQAWKQAKQIVADGITVTQKALDKIDGQLIDNQAQMQALRDAAGPQAPPDVANVVDAAAAASRDFSDNVDTLRSTIDSLNQVSEQVRQAEASGQVGAGSPAQVALDRAKQTAQALGSQVATLQRSGSAVTARIENATQTVNRYVDNVNAQAAALMQQQAQQAQATDIAYQLTDQQKALQFQQSQQQQQIAQAQAKAQADYAAQQQAAALQIQQQQQAQQQAAYDAAQARAQADAQAQASYAQQQAQQQAAMQAQLAAQQQQFQQYLAQLASQSQPPPPSYPIVQYPPAPQPYAGGAQYAQQYAPPSYQPQQSPQYDPGQYYQTSQYGGGFDGPGEAGSEWGVYVEGARGQGVGAGPVQPGASPSGTALATATARSILAQANLKLADARKVIERDAAVELAKATSQQQPPAETSQGGFWTTGKKVGAAVLAGALGFGLYKARSA